MPGKRKTAARSQDPGLGRLLKRYNAVRNREQNLVTLGLAGLCLLGGLALLSYGIWAAYQRYFLNGPATVLRSFLLPGGAALAMLALAVYGFMHAARTWGLAVMLYERGFLFQDWQGSRAYPWSDITSIQVLQNRSAASGHSRLTLRITTRDGRRRIIDNRLAGARELAGRIREQAAPLLFASYNNAFNTGQTLAFGPLRLQREKGISYQGKTLPWSQFKEATLRRGKLDLAPLIREESQGFSIALYRIPNLDVLFSLLDEIPGDLDGAGGDH